MTTSPLIIKAGRDKSLTHRAIIFACLAKGDSKIENALLSEDCLATIDCFQKLGVKIDFNKKSDTVQVSGLGIEHLKQPTGALDCQNSGTTARLLTGLFAGIPDLTIILNGDASLRKRPMKRVTDPLSTANRALFRYIETDGCLPLNISGAQLNAARYEVKTASAQVKSALLLAGIKVKGHTIVELPAGSRDHTERFIKFLGGHCHSSSDGTKETVTLKGPVEFSPFDTRVPADPSSAAFFAVLALLKPAGLEVQIPEVLANPTRIGFVKVLQRIAGSAINIEDESDKEFVENTMTLKVSGGHQLKSTTIEAHEIPRLVDEVPVLAILAAFAEGSSRFCGLSELRVKESDRLSQTLKLLQVIGAEARIEGDDLLIAGSLESVRPFSFDPLGDHRLAMCANILAHLCDGLCELVDSDCVSVSFPTFFEELAKFE